MKLSLCPFSYSFQQHVSGGEGHQALHSRLPRIINTVTLKTMGKSSHKTIFLHLPLSHSALGSSIYTLILDPLSSQIKCDQSKWQQYTWIHHSLRSRISLWLCCWSCRNEGTDGTLCLPQISVIWAQIGPRASALSFRSLKSKTPARFLLPMY